MQKEIITLEQIKKIREYYRSCPLWNPSRSSWRSWKMKLIDSTWKKFFIKDEKELRKLLIKYTPLRVFYSAIAVLNIQNIKGKQNKNFPIKIFQDLIIDIDNEDFDKARESALEIINRLGEPDYILKTYKGIHLNYFKKGQHKQKYLELIKDIPFIDIKTILNDYNEFSCPLTLNKGKVCIFLTCEQLKNVEIKYINELQPTIYSYLDINNLPKRLNADETTLNPKSISRKSTNSSRSEIEPLKMVNRNGTKIGEIVHSFHNKVKSKLYIPILIYDKNLKGLKEEIKRLDIHYDLGCLYVFKSENNIAFISLKIMDKHRLSKILNSSRSITKFQFQKFHKIWFNISEWTPLIKINFESKKFFRASRKHYEALLKIGFSKVKEIDEFVGSSKLNIYEVMIN